MGGGASAVAPSREREDEEATTELKDKKRVLSISGLDPLKIFGAREQHLDLLDRKYPGAVVVRGDDIILSGASEDIDRLTEFFGEIIDIARGGRTLSEQDFRYILENGNGGSAAAEFNDLEKSTIVSTKKGGSIKPRTPGQKRYLDAIRGYDVVFGIGPAGTGKTYVAVACAVAALKAKRIDRIFLVRPVVEAGESLGYLPGDFQAKLDPYVRPVVDALYDMLGPDRTLKLMDNGTIEIAPLAYMRGRTLSDAFVILDEAQNTTTAQMKMFLTRLGLNSKAVITGDKTQIDLPRREDSGLLEVERILQGIDGISFVYLSEVDVVRHRLVKDIIRAYAKARSNDSQPEAK